MSQLLTKLKHQINQAILTVPFLYAFGDLKNKKPSFGVNLDALDGLRGLAVLLVIASHTNGLNMHGQGGLGVWVFFTLSGFLLSYPISVKGKEINTAGRLFEFWLRRVKRILPMYYLMLFVIVIFSTHDWNLFAQHLTFMRGDGHFWSIPQELFFYMLLPFLIVIVSKISRKKPLVTAGIFFAIGILSNIFLTVNIFHFNEDNINLQFYLLPFTFGCATSYLMASKWFQNLMKSRSLMKILALYGLAVLIIYFISAEYYVTKLGEAFPILSIIKLPASWNYVWFFSLLTVLLIIVLVTNSYALVTKLFKIPAIRLIGIISYSMYLIHPFIIIALSKITESANLLFVLTLTTTIVFSLFTYGLIERPFTKVDFQKKTILA